MSCLGRYIENYGKSINAQVSEYNQKLWLDINLRPRDEIGSYTVQGRVTNSNGHNVSMATVKFLDGDYNILNSCLTNESGEYRFFNIINLRTYRVAVAFQGKEYYISEEFVVNDNIDREILLTNNPSSQIGHMVGRVVSVSSSLYIEGAVISIYRVESGVETLIERAYSNKIGQFFIRDIPIGSYIIRVTSCGYIEGFYTTQLVIANQIVNVVVSLAKDIESESVISGVVRDSEDAPSKLTRVVLYKYTGATTIVPYTITYTNFQGEYVFPDTSLGLFTSRARVVNGYLGIIEHIPEGPYIISITIKKSNLTATNIGEPFTTEFRGEDIILSGGAFLDNGVVKGIGFNKGEGIININIPESREWDIDIKYLSSDYTRRVSIDINGKQYGGSFSFMKTPSLNIEDGLVRSIVAYLNQGNNTIKLK